MGCVDRGIDGNLLRSSESRDVMSFLYVSLVLYIYFEKVFLWLVRD